MRQHSSHAVPWCCNEYTQVPAHNCPGGAQEDPRHSCGPLLTLVITFSRFICAAGLICTDCQPHQVVNDAIQDARSICLREYGDAPDVNVYGDPGFAFAYVPSHLHHMVSFVHGSL